MLLTVILGVVTAGVFLLRGIFIKLKVKLSAGAVHEDSGKIPYVIFSTECVYMTASPDDPALEKEYKYVKTESIGEGNKCFARLNMMKAGVCLSTTPGLDVLQWKRSKDVCWYAHIFHDLSDGLLYRMFALDHYDAVLGTGDIQEWAVRRLEELRGIPEREVYVAGSPHLDRLYRQYLEMQQNGSESDRSGQLTVLVAPTWGNSGLLKRFGEELLRNLADTGYRIIIRPHPQSKVSEKEMLDRFEEMFPESDRFGWNYDNDNFRVLSEADVMISDYSGVIFDYAFIFDRPVIYSNAEFDSAPYDAAWTEGKTWSFTALPQMGREITAGDISRIKEVIDETVASESLREARTRLRDEAWKYRGESAVRTVDYMISKFEELS